MSDVFTKKKRSEVMSKVARKDTPQEMLVRKYLFGRGIRYRKNVRKLPGSPDIVLTSRKIVIFVHGCFWHGHECKAGRQPKTNIEFWSKKIKSNKERDLSKSSELKKMGWTVISIWQCELTSRVKQLSALNKLHSQIISISKIRR